MITIYGTKECPACVKTKEFLTEKKVEFKYVEIGKDISQKDYIELSGLRTVPFIDWDGKPIYGYNKLVMEQCLNLKK